MGDGEPWRVRWGRRLLFLGFVVQVPLGMSIAFGYRTPLWAWHRTRMAVSLGGTNDVPAAAVPYVDQLMGMLGATMACWGLAMAVLVAIPMRRGERWAVWCIFASSVLWFVVDTGLSAHHGVMVNVWFNVAAMAMISVPLAMASLPRRR